VTKFKVLIIINLVVSKFPREFDCGYADSVIIKPISLITLATDISEKPFPSIMTYVLHILTKVMPIVAYITPKKSYNIGNICECKKPFPSLSEHFLKILTGVMPIVSYIIPK
jgi:hypothetical protein